jgi:DNA-binding SARP family transcriptional activator
MLLAVLAAHHGASLTRDLALDILWPDAEPELAINSLNQTVFQLRRYIDASYRGGESPEYIVSTAEQVGLNPDLVRTDIVELRRLPGRLATVGWEHRQMFASRAVQLVRGEFLADMRYEDWASRQQLSVHREVRDCLLPIAQAPATTFRPELAAQAASALLMLDPFDEQAVLALAGSLSESGQRAAARQVVVDFIHRLDADLDLEPTDSFQDSASRLDPHSVKQALTSAESGQLRA